MDVYFNGNYWGHKPYQRPGKPMTLNISFEWANSQWQIPAAYICKEGMVVDICRKVPMALVEEYQKRWGQEMDAHQLSNEEMERMEQDSPFHLPNRPEFCVDGEVLSCKQGCGVVWHTLKDNGICADKMAEMLMDTYELDRTWAWDFMRWSIPWAGEKPKSLETLSVIMRSEKTTFPCEEHFVTTPGCQPFDTYITHPVSKEVYQIHVVSCVQEVLDHSDALKSHDMIFPTHLLKMEYYMTPDFEDDVITVMDCGKGDPPVKSVNSYEHSGACAVSIIGGASGPTSIFLAGKAMQGTPEVKLAFSALHFEPVEEVEWRMSFHIEQWQPMTFEIF